MWWLMQMWWLVGSAPDFWGRGPGFESGIYHIDPDALQDRCEIMQKISRLRGKPTPDAKKDLKKKKKIAVVFVATMYISNLQGWHS